MCGISGIFSKKEINDSSIINSLKSIKHRGLNNTIHASFLDNVYNLYSSELSNQITQKKLKESKNKQSKNWIGFNRLSIVDLTENGMQPFYDEATKTSFMMNGEVYNFKTLKKEFLQDEQFTSETDSEVVFKLYLKFGDSFVEYLKGMFVIVITNHQNNTINVWRDRFGIKPFYYFLDKQKFIFSSEINGIFTTNLVDKKINYKHLAYTFYLNTNFAPNTIYHNIQSLEPATKLTVDLNNFSFTKTIYWRLDYKPNNQRISESEFLEDINNLIQLASVGDVKQAIMLSGGLDSGLLAYQFGKNNIDADALTIFNTKIEAQNELLYAKSNAKNAQLNLKAFEIENDSNLEKIKEYCMAEEEPNLCPEPAYFLAKEAYNNNYIILQNALGLDELFYGYGYYNQINKLKKIQHFLFTPFKFLLKGSKRYKYEELSEFGLEASPLIFRSISSWEEIKLLFEKYDSQSWEHPISLLTKQIKLSQPNFDKFPLLKKISYLDFYYYISSHHSFRSDRPSMKLGIEMRFPYLDHHFVQKYFNISDLEKGLTKNNNKPFLRKMVRDILPKDVLNMSKKGFSMPTENWIKHINLEESFPELENIFDEKYLAFTNHPSKKWLMISTALLIKDCQNE
ncbi:asparagine synthase (glutamine-hydrolyzing) [Chishuiella changwenlii]|uniref:asparagine synthase (glutamine-hydrolyzing) n=1 Tax=Chishuiella changwenlii TaxID=1434701 RepID=UPI002FD92055